MNTDELRNQVKFLLTVIKTSDPSWANGLQMPSIPWDSLGNRPNPLAMG